MRQNERKEQNKRNKRAAFEKSKQLIEKENLEKSKKYIEKYISNTFLKEFILPREKQIEFKVSLISRIQNLTQEFINNCQKFINSFKSNTEKIIAEFDIKEIEPIEHINFIVVGKAGVGKSTFINETLLLPEDKRAKEGVGESVTLISSLYSSDKLKMIRMWDTPGLDDKVTKDCILKEIQRLIDDGINKGPDHYINIILYCTSGLDVRFQKEDEELIKAIMNIYPFENLPVIITQLQSYMPLMAQNMEKAIRNVLKKYLGEEKEKKIEIKSIISRVIIDKDSNVKAHGIPELLRLSFDIMGRSIASATCRTISEGIEKLCQNFMNKKKSFVENIFKYEMEILELGKNLFTDNLEEEEEEKNIFGNINELSENNIYKNIDNPNYFIDNFSKIIEDKFLDIFNNLENDNLQLNNIENENIEQENNIEENKEQENNLEENKEQENNADENKEQEHNEQNNMNENEEQQNIENENEQEEESEEEEEKEENEIEENKEQENNAEENNINENLNQNENNQIEEEKIEKSPIELLLEENLKKLRRSIDEASNKTFNKIFKKRLDDYLKELLKEQREKNIEFHDDDSIIDILEVENGFKEKLLPIFKNEFFKIFLCIILKLFINNLKEIFESIVKKELTENEEAKMILQRKAENSLKIITENLKNKLISELDIVMKEKEEENNNAKKENENNDEDIDFAL